MTFPKKRSLLLLLYTFHLGLHAQLIEKSDHLFSDLSDLLFWESSNQNFAIQVGGQIDLTAYHTDDPGNAPGFFFPDADRHSAFNPRLEITADVFLGEYIQAFGKLRWDQGVHPGVSQFYGSHSEVRIDELYVKTRLGDTGMHLRVGQFTPQIGGFFARQSSWDNALISYPLVYENVTSISDYSTPANAAQLANRATLKDQKLDWVPILWAPLYPRGASIDGAFRNWSYSLNFLNSNISSRGISWNDNTWADPTLAGRVGYRPTPNWDLGISFSTGSHLREPLDNRPALPTDFDVADYAQETLGLDISYAGRKWQIWSELWVSRFELPGFSEAPEVYSYFIEGRHEVTPRSWVSLRWNQEFYNRLTDPDTGAPYRWDNPLYRIDLGYGIRWSRHLQTKLQYSYQHQDADFQNARHFAAIECVIKL